MRRFDIAAEISDGLTLLRVSGDLDASNVEVLKSSLNGGRGSAPTNSVVIDLSECDFIDSSGIAAIVEAWHGPNGSKESQLVLAGPRGQVERILAITGLDAAITVFDGADEAVKALSNSGPVSIPE